MSAGFNVLISHSSRLHRPLEEGGRRLKFSTPPQCGSAELSAEDQELLKLYHHSFDDERVDLDLIMDLLHNICSTSSDGETLSFCLSIPPSLRVSLYVHPSVPPSLRPSVMSHFSGMSLLNFRRRPHFSPRIRRDCVAEGSNPGRRQEILLRLREVNE